jgi:hypothetical protein
MINLWNLSEGICRSSVSDGFIKQKIVRCVNRRAQLISINCRVESVDRRRLAVLREL